ncbi:4-hydroxy-2-oxovalerate aldolase [Pseudomonas chlororaphis subsp. aureofaciens]|uniref:nucleoid-structuring protein H-NS n=1 Tax=Pseudomonas chlororaphis TaxID=587753 RepID=UPI000F5647B3|nr:nucleoid-structuring protein H-NS [Pseudomonas chlororaphis]AZE13779.1 4-hydroxy-2-oxovalerate aldolase [Pseudomonas chlororaphis subsp. aureofaciens]
MNNVKIIDVTLRDGGYRNNFEFTTDYAANAVGHLVDVGVGHAEIGYCNGSFIRKKEHGLSSSVSPEYIESLRRAACGQLGLCVMVHPRNVTGEDFEMLAEHGVGMIRVCLRAEQLEQGVATIELAKSFNFQASANITHITTQTPGTVTDMALRAEGAGADVIYFADSNGNMIPDDVERLVSRISRRVHVPLGFHAHNNLSLALSNSIAAVEAGAEYIDTSICGMGKGAGNLHLGMFIAYLERVGSANGYDLVKALQLSEYTAQSVPLSSLPTPLMDVMLGAYNLPFDVQQRLEDTMSRLQISSTFQALRAMHEQDLIQRHAVRPLVISRSSFPAHLSAEGKM